MILNEIMKKMSDKIHFLIPVWSSLRLSILWIGNGDKSCMKVSIRKPESSDICMMWCKELAVSLWLLVLVLLYNLEIEGDDDPL